MRSDPVCETVRPELREARPGHWVATFCELNPRQPRRAEAPSRAKPDGRPMTGLIKNDKAGGGIATAERENVVEVRDLTVAYEIRTRGRRRTLLTARASTSTGADDIGR